MGQHAEERGMSDAGLSEPPSAPDPPEVVEAVIVPARPPGPGFWAALGFCFLILAGQVIVVMIAAVGWIVVQMAAGGQPPAAQALEDSLPMTLLIGAATAGTLACAVLVVAVVYRRRLPRVLALRQPTALQWLVVLLAVLPLSIVASEVTNWVAAVLPQWSATGEMFARLAQESLPAALVFGALLAGLGEEIYFRGFIGRGLVARYGPLAGVLLTSLLFGLVHFEPIQATGAMVLGIGIHAIYLGTRSLYAPIAVHILNNAMAFVAFALGDRLRLPGYIPGPEGVIEFTPWPVLLAALAAIGGLACVLWDTRTRWILPDGQAWDPGYLTAEQPPAEVDALPHCHAPRLWSWAALAVTQAVFLAALASYAA
jgi:membrane protease YdiL (CAAX protease family)